MKKMFMIAIASVIPMFASVAQQPSVQTPAQPYPLRQQDVQSPMAPTPGWHMIASYPGPTIPVGWQVINVESVIQNGTSVQLWLVYLYKPTTRQTAGWLIGLNP